ncbi:hypothetical protein BEP19_03735 [Ammoniphilus oxalaticus]|uniref:DUF4912 domain-containing protein n=1 Tax=Ammoniphilus oxalaticus TaxID=66863 RepID=A0A419SLM0_9BACL|nr:DUF4912 domain-containing protein [Ammoniphilus oxalaticus]RKD24958.1 hypothetical protein BEP19_03735 [Ammoniphilus oxalaticus]
MNPLLQKILGLRDQGLTHQEIADELQITIGRVRYQLYRKSQPETNVELNEKSKEQMIQLHDAEVHPNYGEDQLVLLPQGPASLYAYWEITDDRKKLVEEHFSCSWGVLPKVLRVYDVTDVYFNGNNAHYYKDVQIHDLANNWFVNELGSRRNYCLDYGTLTLDGRYFTILRSDPVQLPASEIQPWREHATWRRPAESIEPEWLRDFTGYTLHGGADRRKLW